MSYFKKVNLGYKYRLYPTREQKQLLNHQMFVYNQAYNICLNLWKKEQKKNKNLEKKDRIYRSETSYDVVVKRALKFRKLKFSTVVTQQARINFLKAVKKAFSKDMVAKRLKAIEEATTSKEKRKAYRLGMPTFKSSKDINQSFNWNNQGCNIIVDDNKKFGHLSVLKKFCKKFKTKNFKFRYHRKLPKDYKLSSITISKDSTGYFVSFGIEFKKEINLTVSSNNINIAKSIGIDLNAYNIAISQNANNIFKNEHNNQIKISSNHLIDNSAENRKKIRYARYIKTLERKQSRRVLKVLKNKKKSEKLKLGANHKKTQRKINKKLKKLANQKKDLYHKISKTLTDKFELIAVEGLQTKNMSKSAKGNEINHGKMVKQNQDLIELYLMPHSINL